MRMMKLLVLVRETSTMMKKEWKNRLTMNMRKMMMREAITTQSNISMMGGMMQETTMMEEKMEVEIIIELLFTFFA